MTYKIWKLIDSRFLEDFSQNREHLICDIDKTYIETPFESLLKLAQIPFEKAKEKVTVSGAKEVLQAYRNSSSDRKPLHFVSASPPMLRRVLSEKLRWDALTWSSDTYKNQGYNLVQGRFSQLRNQVAYKSGAILNLFMHAQSGSKFHMIGDNAESDPIIYLGNKLYVEGRLSRMAYLKYLKLFGVPRLEALQLLRHTRIPHMHIETILIRNLPNKTFPIQEPLTDPLLYFNNFFEAALYMFQQNIMHSRLLPKLSHSFHNYYGISTPDMLTYLELLSESEASQDLNLQCKNILDSLRKVESFSHKRKSLQLIQKKNLDAFSCLKEEDILQLAKEWKAKMK